MRSLAIVVVAILTPGLALLRPQGHIQQCTGETCFADFTLWWGGAPGWFFVPYLFNGQGESQEYGHQCDPCRFCRARVFYTYSGSSTYITVIWPDGASNGLQGNLTLYNDCDQDPVSCVFDDNQGNVTVGELICPCYL